MPVVKQLDKAKQQALEQTGDALLTQVKNTQVMPFDTGNLQNENTFEDCAQSWNGTVKIVSSTPYARRLYFHPEYNFSREENIAAGGKWFSPWLEGGTRQNYRTSEIGSKALPQPSIITSANLTISRTGQSVCIH